MPPSKADELRTDELASTLDEPPDAVEMLTADHDDVRLLFEDYLELGDLAPEDRALFVGEICMQLAAHSRLEEEVFYPAAREVLDDPSVIDAAVLDHGTVGELIDEIETTDPSDDIYEQLVASLKKAFLSHVVEEESELLPMIAKTGIDLAALGRRMASRKRELLTELGGGGPDMVDDD